MRRSWDVGLVESDRSVSYGTERTVRGHQGGSVTDLADHRLPVSQVKFESAVFASRSTLAYPWMAAAESSALDRFWLPELPARSVGQAIA